MYSHNGTTLRYIYESAVTRYEFLCCHLSVAINGRCGRWYNAGQAATAEAAEENGVGCGVFWHSDHQEAACQLSKPAEGR